MRRVINRTRTSLMTSDSGVVGHFEMATIPERDYRQASAPGDAVSDFDKWKERLEGGTVPRLQAEARRAGIPFEGPSGQYNYVTDKSKLRDVLVTRALAGDVEVPEDREASELYSAAKACEDDAPFEVPSRAAHVCYWYLVAFGGDDD